jgi:hypothetical protein
LAGVEHVFLAGRERRSRQWEWRTDSEGGAFTRRMSAWRSQHGPIEMLRDNVFVLVFAGDQPPHR